MSQYFPFSQKSYRPRSRRKKRSSEVKIIILCITTLCFLVTIIWIHLLIEFLFVQNFYDNRNDKTIEEVFTVPILLRGKINVLEVAQLKGFDDTANGAALAHRIVEQQETAQTSQNSIYGQVQSISALLTNDTRTESDHYAAASSAMTKQTDNENIDPLIVHRLGTKYTNPYILSEGCSVTILLMQPNLGKRIGNVWNSLESTISNIHPASKQNACVLLQTSSCDLGDRIEVVLRLMSRKALPETKQMIEAGNVRVTFLNHTKYHFSECNNFYSPSSAWLDVRYWRDEFVLQDSDLVMMIQEDSISCHTFTPDLWRDVAYVGAVWPRTAVDKAEEDFCERLSMLWKKHSKEKYLNTGEIEAFPNDLCVNGTAPLGNGGFSLRSRKWLTAAIEYCPHEKFSGLDQNFIAEAKCTVPQYSKVAEDIYFASILRGIRAPMPSAFEAALFSTEMVSVEKVLESYGTLSGGSGGEEELEEAAKRRWGDGGLDLFRRMRKQGRIVPIGMHKPYMYNSMDELKSDQMKSECKFLQNIIPLQKKKSRERNFRKIGLHGIAHRNIRFFTPRA